MAKMQEYLYAADANSPPIFRLSMSHIFCAGHKGCLKALQAAGFRPCRGPGKVVQGKGASDGGHARLSPWVWVAR